MNLKLIGALIACVLFGTGCGPSERELKLQAELEKLRKEQEKFVIKGSVFVATKGGTSYKLALIKVTATPRADFDKAKAALIESISKKSEDLSLKRNQLVLKYNELAADFKVARKSYDTINAQMESIPSVDGVYKILRTVVYYRTDSPLEVRTKDRLYELSVARNTEAEKLAPQRRALVELLAEIDSLEKEAKQLVDGSTTVLFKTLEHRALYSATSDADGNFILIVPRTNAEPVILTAMGSRAVVNETEEYLWLSEVNVPLVQRETRVFLANNELVSLQVAKFDFSGTKLELVDTSIVDSVYVREQSY
jgi:hypothetical protein